MLKYGVRSTSTFTSESSAAHSPQTSSWLFAGLSVEGVTWAIRSFKELLGSTQQNISVQIQLLPYLPSTQNVRYFLHTTAFLSRSLQCLFFPV